MNSCGKQWPLLQFDIDDGLCVRAPMDERELKKQFPLQALLEEEQGPNDSKEGCARVLVRSI